MDLNGPNLGRNLGIRESRKEPPRQLCTLRQEVDRVF